MLQNLCVDVQPMLCIVQLLPGQVFDENLKEGYSYFTIGGNHSRAALQVRIFAKHDIYVWFSSRHASVHGMYSVIGF